MPKARKAQNKEKRDILSSDSEDEHQENSHNKKKQKQRRINVQILAVIGNQRNKQSERMRY